jgi:hypothetical protein
MSELKCEKKTVIKVEYYDLEAFIKEVTGNKHEIVAAEEAHNDMTLTFEGIGDNEYDEFDAKDFAEWRDSGKFWPWGTRTILEGLCAADFIEAGDYYVHISW